jgi:hypothetical protein
MSSTLPPPSVIVEAMGYCKDCLFWDWFYTNDKQPHESYGLCRRYAPRPMTQSKPPCDGERNVEWPNTLDNEFCGEYRPSIRQAEKE